MVNCQFFIPESGLSIKISETKEVWGQKSMARQLPKLIYQKHKMDGETISP